MKQKNKPLLTLEEVQDKKNQRKYRFLILGVASFTILVMIGGIISSSFGFAYDSMQIINSLKTDLKNNLDNNHLVIDHTVLNNKDNQLLGAIPESDVVGLALKCAYEIDALSTLNQQEYGLEAPGKLFSEYETMALNTFKKDWIDTGYLTENEQASNTQNSTLPFSFTFHKDINLYQYALKLLDFDQQVAKKYKPFYVTPGIELTTNLSYTKQILAPHSSASDLYQEINNAQKIINQNSYDDSLTQWASWEFTGTLTQAISNQDPDLSLPFISHTAMENRAQEYKFNLPGLNLANNKIWFSNWQLNNVRLLIDNGFNSYPGHYGYNVFNKTNADWYNQNSSTAIKNFDLNSLHKVNYNRDFAVLKTGTVVNFIITPFLWVLTLLTITLAVVLKPFGPTTFLTFHKKIKQK